MIINNNNNNNNNKIIETLLKSPQKIYLQIFTQSETKILMKIKISLGS